METETMNYRVYEQIQLILEETKSYDYKVVQLSKVKQSTISLLCYNDSFAFKV